VESNVWKKRAMKGGGIRLAKCGEKLKRECLRDSAGECGEKCRGD
jgi:hypothetical protein